MKLVEYIYTPQAGQYGIDLGYVPTTSTRVKIRAKLSFDGNLTLGVADSANSWFRFFTYQQNMAVFDCPFDSQERIEIQTNTDADYVDYEFGFKDNGQTMYLQDSLGHYDDRSAAGYNFNFTDQFKVWGDKFIYADSRIYDIEVYEGDNLVKHYQPAFDDVNNKAGLYDGSNWYYANTAGNDIAYSNFPAVSVVGYPLRPSVGASGGSVSGSVIVREDLTQSMYTLKIELLSSRQSAATLTVNGNVVTDFTAWNPGTYDFSVSFPAWDGSGDVDSRGRRNSNYIIEVVDENDNALTIDNTPFTASLFQNSPLVTSQPLYLGDDEVNTVYLGDDEVTAMYLGDDLVFGTAETSAPAAIQRTIIVNNIPTSFSELKNGYAEVAVSDGTNDGYARFVNSSASLGPSMSENTFSSAVTTTYNDGTLTLVGPFGNVNLTYGFTGSSDYTLDGSTTASYTWNGDSDTSHTFSYPNRKEDSGYFDF